MMLDSLGNISRYSSLNKDIYFGLEYLTKVDPSISESDEYCGD